MTVVVVAPLLVDTFVGMEKGFTKNPCGDVSAAGGLGAGGGGGGGATRCGEGQKYCDRSQSCIPEKEACCSTDQKPCYGTCISKEQLCCDPNKYIACSKWCIPKEKQCPI